MTLIARSAIHDFELANKIYRGASVSFFTVDGSAHATTTLAPLYLDPTTSTQLPNPQILDGDGRLPQPVYTDQPVISSISGLHVGSQTTGIISGGVLPSVPRIITTAGTIIVSAIDSGIILNKAVASATPITLPTVASRLGNLLTIADFAGTGDPITITPASGDAIMGLAANSPWIVRSGGAGLGGKVNLLSVQGLGWVVTAP